MRTGHHHLIAHNWTSTGWLLVLANEKWLIEKKGKKGEEGKRNEDEEENRSIDRPSASRNKGSEREEKDESFDSVLSVVEDFSFSSSWIASMFEAAEWKEEKESVL